MGNRFKDGMAKKVKVVEENAANDDGTQEGTVVGSQAGKTKDGTDDESVEYGGGGNMGPDFRRL